MSDPAAPSVAENLKSLMAKPGDKVSVKNAIEKVETHQGLAPVVFVVTLPVLAPWPPGLSSVMALPLLFAAPQMMVGRKGLWLPRWLGDRQIDRQKLHATVERVLPWLERVERLVKPRLSILTSQAGATLAGLVCTLLGVVLLLPIPFTNVLPALTVLMLCLALTRRDGVAMLLSLVLLAAAVIGIVWGFHAARLGMHRLFH
jgi:hypothetical protein